MEQTKRSTVLDARGERKQITAVFVDIVGFSDIASIADAEDLQIWLDDYYIKCRDIIEAHDGEVTEYLGDGIVALFGLTRADELAASKAVNAALAAVQMVTAGFQGAPPPQFRAGVATGEVAVRKTSGTDPLPRATGMVTTLAQRIQERAPPGTVMISQTTQSMLRGGFALQDVPDQKLKGFPKPQMLYMPLPDSARPVDAPPAAFVGRSKELARIAASRKPALLVGQAGIGKTAMVRYLAQQTTPVATFAADGVYTRASYQPFKDWLTQAIGKPLPEMADITARFPDLDTQAQRALALALGLPDGQRLLAEQSNLALKPLLETSLWDAIRTIQPRGMLVFEDLHWLDNASFGVLTHILQSDASHAYQILMTSREDTKIGTYLGELEINTVPLGALPESDANGLIDALGSEDISPVRRASLIATAGGVPLYLQQLYKRHGSDDARDIPDTLMDLLAEQIDAAGAAKPLLQCGAVIGRQFDRALLQALTPEHEKIGPLLSAACAQGVVEQRDADTWAFSHALLHQAAYQGMLRKTRSAYHGIIAQHLQDHHGDKVMRNPTMLTDHLRLAGQHIPAIQNYLTVSQWALFQGAFADAESHILAGLSLCDEVADTVDVADLKISCLTALGAIRMQTQGFTAPPVKDTFEAVAQLAVTLDRPSIANSPAFFGSFSHAIIAGDRTSAVRFNDLLAQTASAVANQDVNDEVKLAALNTQICFDFYAGDFLESCKRIPLLRDTYDISRHGAMIVNYGMDSFAAAQMFEVAARAIIGDQHLVADLLAETDAHQDQLNLPVMLPYAQIWGAVPLFYSGDTDAAMARLMQGLATANDQHAAFWQLTGAVWRHVMDPSLSDSAEGLAEFSSLVDTHAGIGSRIALHYFRAHLATSLMRHGEADKAVRAARQAAYESTGLGLFCWHAETLRLCAAVLRDAGLKDEAQKMLAEAATCARDQNAGLWALRTGIDQVRAGETDGDTLRQVLDRLDPAATLPEITTARALL